jgi:hypothetical protein
MLSDAAIVDEVEADASSDSAAWPMTDSDSRYRPQQMITLTVSNKTLLEIYRDMFIPPFDPSGLRTRERFSAHCSSLLTLKFMTVSFL